MGTIHIQDEKKLQAILKILEQNSQETPSLFGIWQDYSEIEAVENYLSKLRKGRF